jgi:hypothetical protein
MSASERTGWRDESVSRRHRKWGFDCPATDLDFMLLEYNHGAPVAVVDYKHYKKSDPLGDMDENAIKAMSKLYDERVVDLARRALEALDGNDSAAARRYVEVIANGGQNLPFFITRYWPDTWAFEALAMNEAAKTHLRGATDWVAMDEYKWAEGLHRIRRIAISLRDQQYLNRLNRTMPPVEERFGKQLSAA